MSIKLTKSDILTGLSIAGVIGTTLITGYMAPKANLAIDNEKHAIRTTYRWPNKHEFTMKERTEVIKAAAPYYIPIVISLGATITFIILNHKECKKELIAASAASAYFVANRDKFKAIAEKPEVKKVIKQILPTKEEFKHQTIEETGNGDLLCIDEYSGRIFRSSEEAVTSAQEKLIDLYLDEEHNGEFGYAGYNDYFYYLNIVQTQWGQDYGWANNEDWYYKNEPIKFSNEKIAADAPGNEWGEPVLVTRLEEDWYPMQCWMEV